MRKYNGNGPSNYGTPTELLKDMHNVKSQAGRLNGQKLSIKQQTGLLLAILWYYLVFCIKETDNVSRAGLF